MTGYQSKKMAVIQPKKTIVLVVTPGPWEPYYVLEPHYSINDVLLLEQDVYRRLRHLGNKNLGYEYATILDIVSIVE
jgi:hypothetical protein